MNFGINHNQMAMNVSRNLGNHYRELGVSTRRLSSGLRIGTAADDAAGLAVRELMRSDVTTLNQGVRNANDAISMIQTADGALEVIDEKLIRMKELAEQAATGTYTSDQRMIIDSEFQAMASEITRIASSTEFNGIKLLNSINPDENPMAVQNWEQINQDGFGNSTTSAIESFSEYNGLLIAGTASGVTGGRVYAYDGASWSPISSYGFGNTNNVDMTSMETFQGSLYAGTWNDANGAQYWKYDGASWAQVNTNGFGDPGNTRIYGTAVYAGSIYLGVTNAVTGAQVWKYDGANWSQVGKNGIDDSHNTHISAMQVYNNELYFGTWNTTNGAQVYKYDGSKVESIMNDGFGDVNNFDIRDMAVYQNKLISCTHNQITGTQVWAYDGNDWAQINESGFGDPDKTYAHSMTVYNNRLYMDASNRLATGHEAVMAYDGETWAQINTDSFGDVNNDLGFLTTYRDNVYIGTMNQSTGTEVWRMDAPESSDIKIHFGTGNSSAEDYYYVNRSNVTSGVDGLNIGYLNTKSQNWAQYSLGEIDRAMIQKDKIRANLGATQNRLENTIANLQIQAENLQDAESQISDVDVADEMTNFVKEQILSQAATAMLAQANSMPKMAIQLISGG